PAGCCSTTSRCWPRKSPAPTTTRSASCCVAAAAPRDALGKFTPLGLLLGAVGVAIGVVGILALREATLSTHESVAAAQTELVMSAATQGGAGGTTPPT